MKKIRIEAFLFDRTALSQDYGPNWPKSLNGQDLGEGQFIMTKIITSVLALSLAFITGVVLGARQTKPEIKKIASKPQLRKSLTKMTRSSYKTSDFKKAQIQLSPVSVEKKVGPSKVTDQKKQFLNKKRTGYTVLLSSFKLEENANEYAKKIAKKGYDAFYFSKEIQGKTWHRVGVGSFSTKSTAESLKKQLVENRLGQGSLISTIPQNNSY